MREGRSAKGEQSANERNERTNQRKERWSKEGCCSKPACLSPPAAQDQTAFCYHIRDMLALAYMPCRGNQVVAEGAADYARAFAQHPRGERGAQSAMPPCRYYHPAAAFVVRQWKGCPPPLAAHYPSFNPTLICHSAQVRCADMRSAQKRVQRRRDADGERSFRQRSAAVHVRTSSSAVRWLSVGRVGSRYA